MQDPVQKIQLKRPSIRWSLAFSELMLNCSWIIPTCVHGFKGSNRW